MRKVRIFVASPTDVMAERERAARVLGRLQSRFRESLTFLSIFFEDDRKYYTADKSFQEQIPDAGTADLLISIFWSKLGSELPPDLFGTMPNGKPYPGGAVYELIRALEAKRQKNVPDIIVYRKVATTAVSVTDVVERRLMTEQLDAFEAFWRQWFVSREGHFRAGFQVFSRTDDFEQLLEGHLRAWLVEKGFAGKDVIWRIAERGSPFRALEPYETRHADVFFGRSQEIDRGRERLLAAADRGTSFLIIMGPSGAGKSSLARAGLVTRMTQPGDIDGADIVRFAVMRPGAAETPQHVLAEALFQATALPELVEGDFRDAATLAAAFTTGVTSAPILRSLGRIATHLKVSKGHDRPVDARLLLVIDQLEELFSAQMSDAIRQSFIGLVEELARSGQVYLVATLRSSSYDLFARHSKLVALKDAGATLDIAVPGLEALVDIVRLPAAAAGLEFERGEYESLDEALLKAAGGNSDALPLLGFTLQWLFEHRAGERLTFEAYRQLGGLEGAIGRAAEQAFVGTDKDAQATLSQLLRRLAEASSGTARLALCDMPLSAAPEGTALRRLVDALVTARILRIQGEGQSAALRLAHEAVLGGWDRARAITQREQDFYRIRRDIEGNFRRWKASGRRRDLLIPKGLPLAEAKAILRRYRGDLPDDIAAFIRTSRRRYIIGLVGGVASLLFLLPQAYVYLDLSEGKRDEKAEQISGIYSFASSLRYTSRVISAEARRSFLKSVWTRLKGNHKLTPAYIIEFVNPSGLSGVGQAHLLGASRSLSFLAEELAAADLPEEANEAAARALEIVRAVSRVAPNHWWVSDTLINALRATANSDKAANQAEFEHEKLEELVTLLRKSDYYERDFAVILNRLGLLRSRSGDDRGAQAAFEEEAVVTERIAKVIDSISSLEVLEQIADARREAERPAAARQIYEQIVAIAKLRLIDDCGLRWSRRSARRECPSDNEDWVSLRDRILEKLKTT